MAIATGGTGVPAMIASGVASGAAGGFAGGAVYVAASGGSFGETMMAGIEGAAMGGMMGGITAGIGAAFGSVSSFGNGFNVWNELGRAGAHAVAQGGFTAMQGGNFGQGAAAGFVSSFAGSLAQGYNFSDAAMVGVSIFSGGAGAAIAGAKSEDILFGMVSGAMVGMLNHLNGNKAVAKLNKEVKKAVKGAKEYAAKVGAAGGMTVDWVIGKEDGSLHDYNLIANALKDSPGILKAVQDYYKTGKTSGSYKFGLKGLFKAGFDPIEQFIGSYNYKINAVNGKLHFMVTNTTSFASAAYHIYPYKWN